MLNLPISVVVKLKKAKNILILGMCGDGVFSGLPIYFTLNRMGIRAHLSSYTRSNFETIQNHAEIIPMSQGCVGVGPIMNACENLPEGYLSTWFSEIKNEDVKIWTFKREQSVKEYSDSLNILVKHLGIDAIILVDAGIDSIMVGDEEESGIMMEDSLTLAAVKNTDVPIKMLSCVGFGTEIEDGLNHYLALENMSKINKQQAFYGSCSLVGFMDSFKEYKVACEHVWNQSGHIVNHIQTRIISAAEGEFGDYHMFPMDKKMDIFISPFTNVYWFYNAEAPIYNSKIIPVIEEKETFFDAVQVGVPMIKNHILRNKKQIPLT